MLCLLAPRLTLPVTHFAQPFYHIARPPRGSQWDGAAAGRTLRAESAAPAPAPTAAEPI